MTWEFTKMPHLPQTMRYERFVFSSLLANHGTAAECYDPEIVSEYQATLAQTGQHRMAAGDRFPPVAQRDDEHCKQPLRVSFSWPPPDPFLTPSGASPLGSPSLATTTYKSLAWCVKLSDVYNS
jgi:hypothetical protein